MAIRRLHGRLYRSHDLPSINSKGRETKNALAIYFHQRLQESPCFRDGAGSKHMFHGDLEQPVGDSSGLGFLLIQAYARKFRVGKERR